MLVELSTAQQQYKQLARDIMDCNGVYLNDHEPYGEWMFLEGVADSVYEVNRNYSTLFWPVGDFMPTTFLFIENLRKAKDLETLGKLLDFYCEAEKFFERRFLQWDVLENELYLFEYFLARPLPIRKLYYENLKKYAKATPSFLKEQCALKKKMGVYKLFDDDDNLIYVGKSTNLGNRLASSLRERKSNRYSYSLVENDADLNIYELYYRLFVINGGNSLL